jgi:hypothetical protein
MKIDWEKIEGKIDAKIPHVNKTNLHSYQELIYLK